MPRFMKGIGMRGMLAVVALGGVLAGCTSTEPVGRPPDMSTPSPTNVTSETVSDFVLPDGVRELTPVVKQDSPDVYRLVFKGMKPGTLHVWVECDGEGSTPVVVGKIATFATECANPGLSGNTIDVPEGLQEFEVAVMRGLNVQDTKLLVGWSRSRDG